MSRWHYQLMRHYTDNEEPYYAIHEIYTLEDGTVWTEMPSDVTGDSVEDVKKALLLMLKDIEKHGVKDYDNPRRFDEYGFYGENNPLLK